MADTDYEVMRLVAADGDEDTCPLQIRVEMKKLPRSDPLYNSIPTSCTECSYPYYYPHPVIDREIATPKRSTRVDLGSLTILSERPFTFKDYHLFLLLEVPKRIAITSLIKPLKTIRVYSLANNLNHALIRSSIALEIPMYRSILSIALTRPASIHIESPRIVKLCTEYSTEALISNHLSATLLMRLAQHLARNPCIRCPNLLIRDPYILVMKCIEERNLMQLELWNPHSHPVNAFICIRDGIIETVEVEDRRLSVGKRCLRIPLSPSEALSLTLRSSKG